MPARHLILGREGEDAAARFLAAAGLRILARNWRDGRLELDLVCEDGQGLLVFVEVRTRSDDGRGDPAETVTAAKQRQLIRAAASWLTAHDSWDRACRFDVVSVRSRQDGFSITHHPHAFEVVDALDRGHTHWQPW